MAGQLRAFPALSEAVSSRQQHSPTSTLKVLGSACIPPRSHFHLVSSPSCHASAHGGSGLLQWRPRLNLESCFWNGGAFGMDLWVGGSMAPSKRNRNAGVTRAAGVAGKGIRRSATGGVKPTEPGQFLLIGVALAYLTILVYIPFMNVFVQAFSHGVQPFISNLLDPDFQHAVRMTCIVAGIVVPLNTVFGVIIAIWMTRYEVPFKTFLLSCLDLPFSISPVVVGLMLMLLYGRQGVFAPWLQAWNIEVVFALPGMILATCFVTLPFVVREVIPVLLEMDPSEEEAARTMGANDWEVFWHVTFPNIRLGLLYGITLCNARAMGEFGAVSVISGNIVGKTQTLTLFVESAYKEYNTQGAFSAALLLSLIAGVTLFIKTKLEDERAKQLSIR